MSEWEQRTDRWKPWKARIQEFDEMYRGDWFLVFPDETAKKERPKIPNIVQVSLDDRVNTAADVPFSIRCDKVTERASEFAEKKERIAGFYLAKNKVHLMRSRYYQDLNGAGCNFKLVLPDFKSGFPCIKWLNPRHVWPDRTYSPDRPFGSVIIAYQEAVEVLKHTYPEQADEIMATLGDKKTHLVEVIEYYDTSEWVKVAILGNKNGKKVGVTLGRPIKNLIGRVPVSCSARPTPDGEFRGLYDNALPVMNAGNRIFNLIVDGAAEWVTSPIVEHDIENPEDYGRAILHSRTPQGWIRRMPPDRPAGEIFPLLGQMQDHARVAAAFPEGRTGNASQSIISSAGINSLMAPYNSGIAMDQMLEAASWEEVLSLCFEIDEKYLDQDEPKQIAGQVNARTFAETYHPSKDINGDYDIRVEYGGASGGDRFSYEIRLTQQHSNGAISDESYMEALSTVKDVQKERNRLLRERSLKGVLALIDQQTIAGNPLPAIKLAAIVKEGEDVMEHLEEIAELIAPVQQEMQPEIPGLGAPPTGTEAFSEAGAIARGGIAPQENVPGAGSLPPLDSLLVSGG